MTVKLLQSSFQFGEVSPLLHARVDAPQYNRSVKRMRNMLVIPQGGCEKRFGTTYVEAINDHAGSPTYLTDYNEVKPFMFKYSDGSNYLLIFRPLAIDLYVGNVYRSTVVTTYAADDIDLLYVTQSAGVVYINHGDYFPATLIFNAYVMTLNASPTFKNYPTYDFNRNYDSYSFKVKVAGVDIVTAQNLLGTVVTIVSTVPMFSPNYVGGLFFADAGVIRITEIGVGPYPITTVTGRILSTFDSTSSLFSTVSSPTHSILGEDAVVTEIAFSTERGYPQTSAFFQNRLFYGGTYDLPGGVWGSNYNGYSENYLDFDDSEALATNAISTVLQGTDSIELQHLIGFKTLLAFTSSGLYSTSLITEQPLTPTTEDFLNVQTGDSANTVIPLVFDNNVIFFDIGGKKVKHINIAEPTQHYKTTTISVLSPHLVDQPYSSAIYENSTSKDGNWLLMVNSGFEDLDNGQNMEGTLSVYQSVPEQEITAWSLMITDGFFRHVTSYDDDTYLIVQREVDGNTYLFIEQLNFNSYMDCSLTKIQASSKTVTGLDYLEGETVRVRGYGPGMTGYAVMNSQIVTGGQITVEFEVTNVQVGLGFTPEVVPLALNVPLPEGNNLYMPKNIKSFYIDYYRSSNISVNGTVVPETEFDVDLYNEPPRYQTGFSQINAMTGWNPNAEILITQADPLPFTLLGYMSIVEV